LLAACASGSSSQIKKRGGSQEGGESGGWVSTGLDDNKAGVTSAGTLRGTLGLATVQDSGVVLSFASSACIQARAAVVSCLNDSSSDGLRRVVLDEVASLGFGERVEPAAGCCSAGTLDGSESFISMEQYGSAWPASARTSAMACCNNPH
jgi:hypothetical protein